MRSALTSQIKAFVRAHKGEFLKLVRYGVVGLTTNSLGYLAYLAVTWAGVPPKLCVSLMYPLGVTMSFLGHRNYTFNHKGGIDSSLIRFLATHFCGYLINIGLLYFFVDVMGYPHTLIQAVAIFVVAAFLFATMRFFVFPQNRRMNEQLL